MNIYFAEPDVGRYMRVFFTDTAEMDSYQFDELLREKTRAGETVVFDKKITFHYQRKNRRETADIMLASTFYWLAGKRAKDLIKGRFNDLFQFIPAICENEPDTEYYIMLPTAYCDGLNINQEVEETDIIRTIKKYGFKSNAMEYPLFRLKYKERFYDGADFYATDDFKDFITENDINGLVFYKLFPYDISENNTISSNENIGGTPPDNNNTRKKIVFEDTAYKIPLEHTDGTYTLAEIQPPAGKCFTFNYDGNCITSEIDYFRLFICERNISADAEFNYRGGKLISAYINKNGDKLPFCLCFDFSEGKMPELLRKMIDLCIDRCTDELIKELENGKLPVPPLSLYYYEYENLFLNDDMGTDFLPCSETKDIMSCVLNCAEYFYPEKNVMYEYAGKQLVYGLQKRLAEEIPERLPVTDDFEISDPEMV